MFNVFSVCYKLKEHRNELYVVAGTALSEFRPIHCSQRTKNSLRKQVFYNPLNALEQFRHEHINTSSRAMVPPQKKKQHIMNILPIRRLHFSFFFSFFSYILFLFYSCPHFSLLLLSCGYYFFFRKSEGLMKIFIVFPSVLNSLILFSSEI